MSTERALIARAVAGEPLALDQLAASHRPAVLRVARHLLGDPAVAEDVTQDVFVRLQLSLPGFRGDAELSTWMYRITLNLCRDHQRKARRSKVDGRDLDTALTHAPRVDDRREEAIDAERRRDIVRAAIDRLPDDQKEVVLLRYLSDLSYADIARITATPQGTVASRVFRALKRLGQDLEPRHLELIT